MRGRHKAQSKESPIYQDDLNTATPRKKRKSGQKSTTKIIGS